MSINHRLRTAFEWTDERVAELKELWTNGASARVCAEHLGNGLSRSAVLGKINRLMLPRRPQDTPVERKQRYRRVLRPKPRTSEGGIYVPKGFAPDNYMAKPDPIVDPAAHVTIIELQSPHCRWIIGEVFGSNTLYCGNTRLDGVSYCLAHSRMAYARARPANPIEIAIKMQIMRRYKQARLAT